jgi:serine/threonine-protein kinase RsbW
MDITSERTEGAIVVRPKGRLDGLSAPGAASFVESLLDQVPELMALDLENVDYISSAGLSVILSTAKQIQAKGKKFVLCGASGSVARVLQLAGFWDTIEHFHSVAEALGRFDKPFRVVTVPATLESLVPVQRFVLEQAASFGVPETRFPDIELVVEEILVNVSSYAYPQGSGEVEISCFQDEGCYFCIRIVDQGMAFNPLEQQAPALDTELEKRKVGGLGIYLVKKLAANVEYRREDNKNILSVSFFK